MSYQDLQIFYTLKNTSHETTYNVMLIMFTAEYTIYNYDITCNITQISMP